MRKTMKYENKEHHQIDDRIAEMVRKEIPKPSHNPWLERKVLNRLPPKSKPIFSIWEIISIIGIIIGLGFTVGHELTRFMDSTNDARFDFSTLAVALACGIGVMVYCAFTLLRRS